MDNRTARPARVIMGHPMEHTVPGLALAILLAITPAAARAEDPPKPTAPLFHASAIDILDATYGARRMVPGCSATAFVQQLCSGRTQCEIPVSGTVCGDSSRADSVLISTLVVRFRCFPGDTDRAAFKERPFTLRISCRGIGR